MPNYYYPGLISFRYVQQTQTLFGFTQYAPTCTNELPALAGVRGTTAFSRRVWHELQRDRIPYTLHWGQVNGLSRRVVGVMYGDRATRWQAARRRLLSTRGRQVFANEFLERTALAD